MQVQEKTGSGAAAPPALVEKIGVLVASIVYALRSLQLYGPTSLTWEKSLDSVRSAFESIWTLAPEIEVQITADAILHAGKPIFQNSNRNESLAFLMFRDGIRVLYFRAGFEADELPEFLTTLHRARYQPSESDDLVTLLWDKDFVHLRHGYIDADAAASDGSEVAASEQVAAAASVATRNLAFQIHDASSLAIRTAEQEGQTGATANDPPALPGLDATLTPASLHLDPETLVYLQHELEEEMGRNVRRDVLTALLDSFEEPDGRAQSEILEILGGFVPHLVSGGHYRLAAEALSELRTVAERPDGLDKTRRGQLEALTRDLTNAGAVHDLIAALESGELPSDLDAIAMFITHLGPDLLPRLLRAREKSGSKELRTMLDSVTEQLVRMNTAALIDVLRSEDPLVLRAALRLQACLGRADAISETIRLLWHDDERIRLASTEVLVALGGDTALAALTSQLADPARPVRVAALWGLATWRYEPAFATLTDSIDAEWFRTLHSEEQMAILDAYAHIGGPKAIERLGRLLKRRFLLGSSEPTVVRACAARALGVTVHPDAKALLERAREDRDPEVRRAVQRSLRKQGS